MDLKLLSSTRMALAVFALALALLVAHAPAVPTFAQTQVGPPVKLLKKEQNTQATSRTTGQKQITNPSPVQEAISDSGVAKAPTGAIQVKSLSVIDVSSAGLIDDAEGGLGVDMWRGIPRPLVERLLPQLPVAAGSPAMQELARRLLLTRARVPEGDATASSLLGLRVERLSAAGDTGSVNALMGLAPANFSDRNVARAKVDGLLLSGDTAEACSAFQALVADDPEETYWVKGVAFCRALAGAHDQATFASDLLRDLGVRDQPFFAMLRVLAGDQGQGVESLLDPTPLHIAMLKTARLPVPADAIAGASPGILVSIALLPNADLDLRLAAAERAEAAGALDAGRLSEIYRSVTFELEELSDAPSALEKLTAPRANALLYQVAQIREVPTARAEALSLAWRVAGRRGGYATAVRVNIASLKAIDPVPELAWFAGDAVRAFYTAGDIEGARKWFIMVRDNANPGNADAAIAVNELWPLPFLRDARFRHGWDEMVVVLRPWLKGLATLGRTKQEQARYADTVLTLLSAFDFEVPSEVWAEVLRAPLATSRPLPVPGLWLQLRAASVARQVGATALFTLLILGEEGPAGADPIVLSEIVAALRRIALDDIARGIAVEAAMAQMP